MPGLIYIGYTCVGDPPFVLDKVSNILRHDGLTNSILELRTGDPTGGEFYLFLGIDGACSGHEIYNFQQHLRAYAPFRRPFEGTFGFSQIRKMVGADRLSARRVIYWQPKRPLAPLPIESTIEGIADSGGSLEKLERSKTYDHLLTWLSVQRSGSWGQWQSVCQQFGVDSTGSSSWPILRRMRLLGHVEISPDRARWCASPAILAATTTIDDEGYYFLCGQRDTRLLEELGEIGSIAEIPQPAGDGPRKAVFRIHSGCAVEAAIPRTVGRVQFGGPVAHKLSAALPPIEAWMKSLEAVQGIVPEMYSLARVDGDYPERTVLPTAPGLYEFRRKEDADHPEVRPEFTLLFDPAEGSWRRGEWYGLRYIARLLAGDKPEFSYFEREKLLYIPELWRVPEPYERCLVLCSGHLPRARDGWLVYPDVAPQTTGTLASKLGAVIERTPNA